MDYQADLQSAIYAAQSELGDFLKCGSSLTQSRQRASAYFKSPAAQVASTSSALVMRIDGMLAQLNTLQAKAMSDVSAASALKASLENDPSFKAVGGVSPDTSQWTDYVKAALSGKVQQVLSVAGSLGADALAMSTFIAKTDDIASAADDLDDLAAGKGISGALAALSSPMGQLESYLGGLGNKAVIILAIGAAAWMFLPSLIGRGASSAVKGAKRGLMS